MDRLQTLQPTQSTSCTVCTWSQTLLHAHPSTAMAQPKLPSTPSTEYLIQYHGRMIDWGCQTKCVFTHNNFTNTYLRVDGVS